MSKKRYANNFVPPSERPDVILTKEYQTSTGITVKRYVTKHTPEEQKWLEERCTRVLWEICQKYIKD